MRKEIKGEKISDGANLVRGIECTGGTEVLEACMSCDGYISLWHSSCHMSIAESTSQAQFDIAAL